MPINLMGRNRLRFKNLLTGLRDSVTVLITFILAIAFFNAGAQNVLTHHNDNKRTGWDQGETTLTQANVSGGTFGKLYQYNIDGQVYCQPLIVNNISIPGKGTHNIVIIATVNNSVYAFDRDAATLYWQSNLNPSGMRAPTNNDMKNSNGIGACGGSYFDFTSKMGIVGTPVIDGSTNIMYLVSRSVAIAGGGQEFGPYVQNLHALDLTTGLDIIPAVPIVPTFSGNEGGMGGPHTINFDLRKQNQRAALLLYNGVVYISWASHCDWDIYHGWVVGYKASDLSQLYVYNDTPDGQEGGIWMSGEAPSVDDNGNIYVSTGNGNTGDGTSPDNGRNRSSSALKLLPNLTLSDWFTPVDYATLNVADQDYGVDGVMIIPNTHLSLSGSKEGYLYLVDINAMGHTVASNNPPDVLQRLDVNASYAGADKHIHGSPVYLKDDKGKEYVYAWAEDGYLKQFLLSRAAPLNPIFDIPNTKTGNSSLPNGMPGALLSASSNGTVTGTGIIWASRPIDGDANHANVPGLLQAFDATDVTHELWNSNLISMRDSIGTFAKFVPPTIANGKVYVATFSGNVKVYGLGAASVTSCVSPATPVTSPWVSGDIGYTALPGDACYTTLNNGTYTIKASGFDINGILDAFHSVFQPASTSSVIMLTAHIASITDPGIGFFPKVGVMFRSSLDPGSPHVFMSFYQDYTPALFSRSALKGSTVESDGSTKIPSGWVRIKGNGNGTYNGFTSPDGNTWTQVGPTITLNLGANIYGVLAYTSQDNTKLETAVFDNVTAQLGSTPLPVTLIDFSALNKNNQYSLLTWQTSSEIDFDHFEIEHSTATTAFTSIGMVTGRSNTQGSQYYNFTDNNPIEGANYYRLKMVDKDGKYSYTRTVQLNFNMSIISLYPNPAKDRVYLENNINFTNGELISIEMINPLGQHLLNEKITTRGIEQLILDFPAGTKEGVYYIKATNSKGQVQNWKILVRN